MAQPTTTAPAATEHRYDTRNALAADLTEEIATTLAARLTSQARASLVLSGGSTPIPMLRMLAVAELPWNRIDVTLADERWVPPGHADSNERLVRENLLNGPAGDARFVPLKTDAATPEEGIAHCTDRLRSIGRPFDVVVLGMGDDGHTASLFPHSPSLAEGLNPTSDATCIAARPESAPHPRISLTLRELVHARRVLLHITGDSKWAVYQRARAGSDTQAMPIRGILQNRTPVDVYWAP